MERHYTAHWYPDDVLRGSAYRAIVFDHRIDSLLRRAAEAIGILPSQLDKLLAHARHRVMLVNPGEVKLLHTSHLHAPPDVLYYAHPPTPLTHSPALLSLDRGQTVTQLVLAHPQHHRQGMGAAGGRVDSHSPSAPLSPASPAVAAVLEGDHSMVARVMAAH